MKFETGLNSSITANEYNPDAAEGEEGSDITTSVQYDDISVLSKIGLSLALEARIRTKNTEKAPQLIAVETLLQEILGMSADTINIDPQDSVVVMTVELDAYVDLANLVDTTLILRITFQGEDLIAVYLSEGKVYADLSGVGLFGAKINGVDLMGILTTFLADFAGSGGVDLGGMIDGVLDSLTGSDEASGNTYAASAPSNAAAQNAPVTDLISSTSSPMLKILLTNNELILNPNMAIFTSLLGDTLTAQYGPDAALPNISDIRLTLNLYEGLTNLNLRVKLDQKGNYVNLAIPAGSLSIGIGSHATEIFTPSTDNLGGVVGLSVGLNSSGGIAANIDAMALAQSLLDTINLVDFTIYIEKRNDYFFLRNLSYGGTNGTLDTSSIGTSWSTGPTYFSPKLEEMITNGAGYSEENKNPYDAAFVDVGSAISLDFLGDIIPDAVQSWVEDALKNVLKGYSPIFFNNAYRRISLKISKNMTNGLDIPISQLTQVANAQTIEDSSNFEPQMVTAFLKNNVLHLSLYNLLVIDISGLLETVLGWIVGAIADALKGTIVGGIAGAAIDLIWGIFDEAAADWLAGIIGDLTGYGNPLRIGQILDNALGNGNGGIPIVNMYLPELLGGETSTPSYASVHGTISDAETGKVLEGATVTLTDESGVAKYSTETDSSGDYMFVNIVAGTYYVRIEKAGYTTKPETSALISNYAVTANANTIEEANFSLSPYGAKEFPAGTVEITFTVADKGIYKVQIEVDGEYDYANEPMEVTLSAGGNYTFLVNMPLVTNDRHNVRLMKKAKAEDGSESYSVYGTPEQLNLTNKWDWANSRPLYDVKPDGTSTGKVHFDLAFAESAPSQAEELVSYAEEPATSGTITFDLKTLSSVTVLEGTATAVFDEYADAPQNASASFPEGAVSVHPIYNSEFDKELEENGGKIVFSGTGAENSYIVTYDYSDKASAYSAYSAFKEKLEGSIEFDNETYTYSVTEKIDRKYFAAVGYDTDASVEARLFTEQEVVGKPVYRIVLAIAKAVEIPVNGDVEVWLEVDLDGDGRTEHTVRVNESATNAVFGDMVPLTNPGESDKLALATYKQKVLYYQNNARNYLLYDGTDNEIQDNTLSGGTVTLTNLPFYNNGQGVYKVKIRSTVYENVDFEKEVTLNAYNGKAELGEMIIKPRVAPDWITERQNSPAASMLQGIRIRLGADVFDASGDTDPDYTDAGYTPDGIPMTNYDYMTTLGDSVVNAAIGSVAGEVTGAISSWLGGLVGGTGGSILQWLASQGLGALTGMIPSADNDDQYLDANGKPIFAPWTNYITGFEGGRTDRSDSVFYIEAWVSSTLINDVFSMVNNLLLGYCGYGEITMEKRYSAADLCDIIEGEGDNAEILKVTGTFNEATDHQIYDYVFENEADYINANYAAGGRLAGSVVSFALNWALPALLGLDMNANTQETALGLIQAVAYSIDFLIDVLDQATRLLSHLLPFTMPYSMILEKELPGSPLQQEEVYSTMWDDSEAWYQYLTNVNETGSGLLEGNWSSWVPSLEGKVFNSEGGSGTSPDTVTVPSGTSTAEIKIGQVVGQRSTNVKELIANEGILDFGDKVIGYNYLDTSAQYGAEANYNYNAGYGILDGEGNSLSTMLSGGDDIIDYQNLTISSAPEIDDDGNLLKGVLRELDFVDKSVYAKITLNNNVDTLLDRITAFINGASYTGAEMGAMFTTDNYMTAATELRADTILYNPTTGEPLNEKYAAVEDMIMEWIASNITNSYVIITDYEYFTDEQGVTTRKLIGKTYVRDVYGYFDDEDFMYGDISWILANDPDVEDDGTLKEAARYSYVSRYMLDDNGQPIKDLTDEAYAGVNQDETGVASYAKAVDMFSAKDDRFMELDISNNGIRLRSVQNFSSTYYSVPNGTIGMSNTSMSPPTEIIFHDPYNSLDFTAVGGTWAGETGTRRNFNGTGYTVQSLTDIFPNRADINFSDGNSTDSEGVYIYWDTSMIEFVPSTDGEVRGYIYGYIANYEMVAVPVRVQEAVMLTSDDFADVMPEIDPMNFNEEEYIKLLPETWIETFDLVYESYSDTGVTDHDYQRTYMFNNLSWDIDESTIGMSGTPATAYLTYSFSAAKPLDGALAEGASAAEVTIPVYIKVRDLDIVTIEKLTAKEYMNLTLKDGALAIRLAENALAETEFDAEYAANHGTELSTDAATVLGYASRYTALVGYTGTFDTVTVYDANNEDAVYIVYTGVDYSEVEAYAGNYPAISPSVNDGSVFKAYGYLNEHEFVKGTPDEDGVIPDGTLIKDENGETVIVINPFEVTDLYEDFAGLKWLYAEIEGSHLNAEGESEYEYWRVDSVNAEALRNVDITALEHDDYVVTLTISDSLGNTTDVDIIVRIRPRTIVTDLDDEIEREALTPFGDNSNAVTTKMAYDNGSLVLAFYRAKADIDEELSFSVATSHPSTSTAGWPTAEIREFGIFDAYQGRMTDIASYYDEGTSEGNDEALYVVIRGVDSGSVTDYYERLNAAGMMGFITENNLAEECFAAEGRINEFNLPSTLTVDYGDPVTGEAYLTDVELTEGVDFVWVADDPAKLRYDYDASGTWTYTWTARVGLGENTQDLPLDFTINTRIPTGALNVTVHPYSEYTEGGETKNGAELGNVSEIRFRTGNNDTTLNLDAPVYYIIPDSWKEDVTYDTVEIDGTTYMTNVEFLNPVFNGSFYYMTVLVYDEMFGYIAFENVRVTLLKSTIDVLNVNWDKFDPFTTYEATAKLNEILLGGNKNNITALHITRIILYCYRIQRGKAVLPGRDLRKTDKCYIARSRSSVAQQPPVDAIYGQLFALRDILESCPGQLVRVCSSANSHAANAVCIWQRAWV